MLVLVMGLQSASARISVGPEDGRPQIVAADSGLTVSWTAPPVTWQSAANHRVTPVIAGYTLSGEPGTAALPTHATLLALPPDAAPTLQITAVQAYTMQPALPLAAAPMPAGVLRSAEGAVIGGALSETEPNAADSATAPFVALEPMGTLRGQRLARLVLSPVRPLPDGRVEVAQEIRVTIDFGTTTLPSTSAAQTLAADPLWQSLRALVANPQHLSPQIDHDAAADTAPMAAVAETQFGIEVAARGITAVTYQNLAAAGFPVGSVNPANLTLTRAGETIAIAWEGDGDAVFETGERFLFYAEPRFSRWTNTDVYVLTTTGAPDSRMTTVDGAPGGLGSGRLQVSTTAESNQIYTPNCLCGSLPAGRDGDRWIWSDLRQPGAAAGSYDLPLAAVDAGESAQLTLWLQGFTAVSANPDHYVDVAINGADLGTITWDGKTAVTQTLAIPNGVLQTNNTLQLSLPEVPGLLQSGVWLDAAAVEFTRSSAAAGSRVLADGESSAQAYTVALANGAGLAVYDVTDPAQPVRLQNVSVNGGQVTWGDASGSRTFFVTNNGGLQTPTTVRRMKTLAAGSGDYVLITPSEFASALTPLVALRESQGLTAVVQDVQAIYDTFNDGRPDPEAIRLYLANAYNTWNPAPTYVVLVGDGTVDPKRYRPNSATTWIPPYLAAVDPWMGEVPADNRFVMVDGSDILPDMMLGRLPVNSVAELQAVVNKIVQYETNPIFGPWKGDVMFVADNPDSAGDFAHHAQTLGSAYITAPWVRREYFYNGDDTTIATTVAGIQTQWRNGSGLIVFNGHASTDQWAAERLLHLDDVANLGNGQRLPFVMQLTCFTGSFQMPAAGTLDEMLLRQANGGAVGVWGATGLGVARGHRTMAGGFLQTLLLDGAPRIGQATVAGKVTLMAQEPAYDDLVDTFTLFGDPALLYDAAVPEFTLRLPVIHNQ